MTKEWLNKAADVILKSKLPESRLFLLNHVLRCCGGISSWAIGFVQCSNPLQDGNYDDAVSVIKLVSSHVENNPHSSEVSI